MIGVSLFVAVAAVVILAAVIGAIALAVHKDHE